MGGDRNVNQGTALLRGSRGTATATTTKEEENTTVEQK